MTKRERNILLENEATAAVMSRLALLGYHAHRTPQNERWDITAKSGEKRLKIELKAAQFYPHQNGGGRYQANLRECSQHADFLVLALRPGEWVDWWFIVVPARELNTRSVSIYSRHPLPGVCKSSLAAGLGRWDYLL